MFLRQLTAAFVLFILAGVLSAPAMAAAVECATLDRAQSCCCPGEESKAAPAHVDAPDCECPGCACTIEAQETPAPWTTVTNSEQLPLPSVLATPPAVPIIASRAVAEVATRPLRGPPDHARTPLYLLYDTLLI